MTAETNRERAAVERRTDAFTVEWLGGKLLGTRVGDLRSTGDWFAFAHRVFSMVDSLRGRVALCTDLSGLRVLPEPVHVVLVAGMRESNARLVRSAVLLPSTSSVSLDMERLLRDGESPRRRLCRDSAQVKAWLSSCLDQAERIRLDEFLARSPLQ